MSLSSRLSPQSPEYTPSGSLAQQQISLAAVLLTQSSDWGDSTLWQSVQN
uniref:Uncharacterized protein n=1 Tax=Anguilla anguilla TaxID=7936 RepID=A0A0E9VMT0_ANGAN